LIYGKIREERPNQLSIKRACQLTCFSRSGYYRYIAADDGRSSPDLGLRDRIQCVALEWPSYGYRRITLELKRSGFVVNHKKVLRLLREDNLLCLRKKKFVRTTRSDHSFPTYPNLVPELEITAPDQLWKSDITYIRLEREFVYLAVVLDAFTRRCIGWALEKSLRATLALAALRMALRERNPKPGLVHHSDRGIQYACSEYTNLLKEKGIRISMSRTGNPYDNAQVESFIKTLKYEEVYLFEYADLSEARHRIGHFLQKIYNEKRLHSALGYLPPAEFEQNYWSKIQQNSEVFNISTS